MTLAFAWGSARTHISAIHQRTSVNIYTTSVNIYTTVRQLCYDVSDFVLSVKSAQ